MHKPKLLPTIWGLRESGGHPYWSPIAGSGGTLQKWTPSAEWGRNQHLNDPGGPCVCSAPPLSAVFVQFSLGTCHIGVTPRSDRVLPYEVSLVLSPARLGPCRLRLCAHSSVSRHRGQSWGWHVGSARGPPQPPDLAPVPQGSCLPPVLQGGTLPDFPILPGRHSSQPLHSTGLQA